MTSWKETTISPDDSILSAVKVIDHSTLGIALVVDSKYTLLGVITDGDIRRALLSGLDMNASVESIMTRNFRFVRKNESNEKVFLLMRQHKLAHMPVLDEAGRLVELKVLREMVTPKLKENLVVIMAGGLGTRLRPMTYKCPKPLLEVGGRPLLETIIEKFVDSGFYRFAICINYKGHMIEDYFGNGADKGIEIQYIRENKRMGTAGPLRLLPARPDRTFIVINGDLLTTVNFSKLLDFHQKTKGLATMCVRTYESQVPYGVVEVDNHKMQAIVEKPVQRFLVNAGIYVLEPDVLDLIPENTFFDMPNLFEKMLKAGIDTSAFPVREYWLDIGQKEDFNKAHGDYAEHFSTGSRGLQ